MLTNRNSSEAAVLEQYRVSLENLKKQLTVSNTMTELSYNYEQIATEENRRATKLKFYTQNKTENYETTAAYWMFEKKINALIEIYKVHREKAKAAFQKAPLRLEILAINGSQPHIYAKWMQMVKKFYGEVSNNDFILAKLSYFNVTDEEIEQAENLINETEAARLQYLRSVGESESSIQQKDGALKKLDD